MRTPLSERARGRWGGLLPLVGVDSRYLTNRQGPCPICGGKTRFRYDDREGRGTWICNSCGAGDGAALAMRVLGIEFKELAERLDPLIGDVPIAAANPDRSPEDKRAALNRLWSNARPVEADDPVARYLARRAGVVIPPRCLRYVERLRYQADPPTYHPAMIAMVTGPAGAPATIHRTYLTAEGCKAAVEVPRRLMPGTIPDGAAVRLFPPAEAMGIAEGIETALSAASLFGLPVWAAVSADMLAKWRPPDEAREIVVFGDADRKFGGQAAAYTLAHRLAKIGMPVRVELPPRAGADWNDVWQDENATGIAAARPGLPAAAAT